MAQFYTLEEAARVLGMNPEELKAKAQSREVRAFLDGGSWRFRVVDIDELARRRGLGSDAEMRLSDLSLPVAPGQSSDNLSEFQMGVNQPDLGSQTSEMAQSGSGTSDHDILLDDLSLPPDSLAKSSSVIIGMHSTGGKMPSDSDVRLVPTGGKAPTSPSDSDVRPVSPKEPRPSDSDVVVASPAGVRPSDSDLTLVADDTMEHGSLRPKPGDTSVRQAPPALGSSAEMPAASGGIDSDSDFDLAPSASGVIDALQPDTGSDFELSALEEESDEFEAKAPAQKPSDSDVTAADPGFSGINLSRPSDSGIGLQMAPGFGLDNSSLELAPLSSSSMQPAAPSKTKPPGSDPSKTSPGSAPPSRSGSQRGEKDIFDDTDFEVDALDSDQDSDDRTVQLEAASDFELEEGEDTGSEVFAIDEEEDVDQNAATALGPAVSTLEEGEEDDGFDEATSGEIEGAAWDVESETPSGAGARAAAGPVLTSAAVSPEWAASGSACSASPRSSCSSWLSSRWTWSGTSTTSAAILPPRGSSGPSPG